MLNIHTLDANYIQPNVASIYLLTKQHHACFIDTGTNQSIAQIKSALKKHNIEAGNVDYIILTHIHLDHAGGASQMMAVFPKATLVVHPYGAKHMADPSTLIDGTKAVYGERYDAMYGEIIPIDTNRIIATHDGMKLDFQGEELILIDTPGHASHHNCIIHVASKSCFTGDTFGLCYQQLSQQSAKTLLPTTTPVQFSPEKLLHSIDKVMEYQPQFLYLTHFGKYTIHSLSIIQYKEHILRYCQITERAIKEGKEDSLSDLLLEYMVNQIEAPSKGVKQWLQMDAKLNAQGLKVWLNKLQSS